MPVTTFCDGRVLGERRGTDPVVLALHGWGRDRRDLAAVLEGAGFDSIALDLPGFGASPPPPVAWGSAEYAAAVAPVLETFAEPPVVVGHSFGGRVAVHLAASRPEAVRALVLTGVPLLRRPSAPRPSARYRAVRRLHRMGVIGDARMERARSRHGSADYRNASGVMRDVLVKLVNESYEDQLACLRCPTELVWSEGDAAALLDVARRGVELIPDARLTVCPGGNHFSCLRQPAELRAAIGRHLR